MHQATKLYFPPLTSKEILKEYKSKIFLVNEVAANTYVRGIFETDQEGIPIPWVEQIID